MDITNFYLKASPDFNMDYKAIVVKTAWCCCRKKRDSRHKPMYVYKYLAHEKGRLQYSTVGMDYSINGI